MSTRPMTLTQKILAAHAIGLGRGWVQAGDILRIRVDWTIASELAWNGMDRTYAALGRPRLHDPGRFFFAADVHGQLGSRLLERGIDIGHGNCRSRAQADD